MDARTVDKTKPVKPNYDKPWVRGQEHISQEGTNFWTEQRESRGYTREDVELLTEDVYVVTVPQQMIYEDYPGGTPTVDELISLAVLYDTSPGVLLDQCFEKKGRELLDDDAEAQDEARTW